MALVRFAGSVSLRMGLWTSHTAPPGTACRAQPHRHRRHWEVGFLQCEPSRRGGGGGLQACSCAVCAGWLERLEVYVASC